MEAPEGVLVRREDGTEIPCSVLREPALDRDGCIGWVAVPDQDWEFRPGDRMVVGFLPARTSVEFRAVLSGP